MWHGHSGECLHTLPFAAAKPCYVLRPHPRDPSVVATAGYDGCLRLWDARTAALLGAFAVKDVRADDDDAGPPQSDVLDGAFAPDGAGFALTCINGAVHFFGASSDARLAAAPS